MTALLDGTNVQTGELPDVSLLNGASLAGVPTPPQQVQFTQTVPRHLVHRAALSEVFVTDLRVVGDNEFLVGAQWPRRHSFLGPRTRTSHDPMLFVECCRQAGLLVSHCVLDVPLNFHIMSHSKTFAVKAEGFRTTDRPVDVVLHVSHRDVRRRGKSLTATMDFDCYRDGLHIASSSERWSSVSSATYRRLRGDHFAATPFQAEKLPTVDPALVGRERPEDVLLAETPLRNVWALQFDPDHPVLFDHPVDHVPGMVMLEGVRQAALVMVGDPRALPVRSEFDFASYVEFDEPCLIIADEDPPAREGTRVVSVTLQQDGSTVATGMMEMLLP